MKHILLLFNSMYIVSDENLISSMTKDVPMILIVTSSTLDTRIDSRCVSPLIKKISRVYLVILRLWAIDKNGSNRDLFESAVVVAATGAETTPNCNPSGFLQHSRKRVSISLPILTTFPPSP